VRRSPLVATLLARAGRGAELGLGRMRAALDALGRPDRALPVVHVAGTNGKGSTAAMVEAVGRAAGLRTGLYTSPHLGRLEERIRIDGAPIGETLFEEGLAAALDPALPALTFFEAMTVAALFAMRRAGVELAVLEVGLGGRLDATNVVERPLVTAITSIGLDHTVLLGADLASIAREKAGIFKPGVPVVLGPMPAEALEAALAVARATGSGRVARVVEADTLAPADDATVLVERRRWPEAAVRVAGPGGALFEAAVALAGAHQARNAAVAAAISWELAPRWPRLSAALATGLARVDWPGRLERIERDGTHILLDCAHNLDGVEALVAGLGGRLDPARTTLVFGALTDKPWRAMLERLGALAHRRIYAPALAARVGTKEAVPPQALAAALPGEAAPSPATALAHTLAGSQPGDTVLVAGSIYLVGAVRAALFGLAGDGPVPL
jgi:dihydrofolate synthase/folylpolyglutamate synthase